MEYSKDMIVGDGYNTRFLYTQLWRRTQSRNKNLCRL
jgi:hypothetical protein